MSGRTLGVVLADGVTRTHLVTLYGAAFMTIGLVTGMAILTPYLLTETLGLPEARQGRALGQLAVVSELTLLALFGPIGALSDRYGRRLLYVAGFVAMAAAYALFPYARTLTEFSLIRVLYSAGIGAATGMYGTLLADYAVEGDRGKLTAIGGILNGLGIVLAAFALGALPALLMREGLDTHAAARATTGIAAAACLAAALWMRLGLKPGTPAPRERLSLPVMLARGIAAARRDPEIALGYASAFVARGDIAIVGIFTVAWGKLAAVQDGLSPAAAIEAGRLPFIIAQGAALVFPLAIVAVIDRLPRATMLGLAMALGAAGYGSMLLVDDPLARSAIPWFALLGIGQISAVLGAQSIIAKAARVEERGAVVGLFNVAGAIGILALGGVGGWAFDRFGPVAPFLIVGALNGLVALAAIPVARRAR